MFHNFLGILRDEGGQGLVEYALIIMLVAIVVIGILTTLGANVTTVFTTISDKLAAGS